MLLLSLDGAQSWQGEVSSVRAQGWHHCTQYSFLRYHRPQTRQESTVSLSPLSVAETILPAVGQEALPRTGEANTSPCCPERFGHQASSVTKKKVKLTNIDLSNGFKISDTH